MESLVGSSVGRGKQQAVDAVDVYFCREDQAKAGEREGLKGSQGGEQAVNASEWCGRDYGTGYGRATGGWQPAYGGCETAALLSDGRRARGAKALSRLRAGPMAPTQ